MVKFFQGMGLPVHGADYLLKRPKLWLFIIIPLLINIILFLVFLIWGYSWFAAPFNDYLAETVEKTCGFEVEDHRSIFHINNEGAAIDKIGRLGEEIL